MVGLILATLLLFRERRFLPLAGAALLGGAILTIHLHSLSNNALKSSIGMSVEVVGVVTSDPRATRERVVGSQRLPARVSFTLRAEELVSQESRYRLRVPVRVIADTPYSLFPGERISLTGRVAQSRELDVAALLIATGDIKELSAATPIRSGLEELRRKLRDRAARLGGDTGALLPGLAIGDTSLQSSEFASVMRRAGLSHLTAVSGANFAIVSAFIFAIVGWFVPRLRMQIAITSVVLVLFIILVRPTPSVLRAAVMAAIFLLARASGRRRQAGSALAIAVAALLLINPFQAFEPGFILSVSATAGLIYLAPLLQRHFNSVLPNWLAEILAVAAAASICCTPYLLTLSESVGAATVLANVLVAPAIPVVTILVFAAALFVIPWVEVSDFLLWLAHFGAAWIVQVASWSQAAPLISASPLIVIAAITSVFIYFRLQRRWIIAIALVVTLILVSGRIVFPGTNWRIGQCDVGQGDALLINLGGGAAALFDAGPDPVLLERCLDLFSIKSLPLVVISHRHADHYAGLPGVGERPIGVLWVNDPAAFPEFDNAQEVSQGISAQIGSLFVEALWPLRPAATFDSVAGDGSAENNRSIVLLAKLDDVRVLVTGDIEPGAQDMIAAHNDLSDIDILKVPHHGSRFQASDFLRETGAKITLVSVGANSYGHPDPELITRLVSAGARVFRTDRDGAIALAWRLESAGPIFSARKLGKEWWRISWR